MEKSVCTRCKFYRRYAVVVPHTSATRYHKCLRSAEVVSKENFVSGHKWVEYDKTKDCGEQNSDGKCAFFEKASWWSRFWNKKLANRSTLTPK